MTSRSQTTFDYFPASRLNALASHVMLGEILAMRTSEKIRAIRKIYRWTQHELGEACSLGQKMISRFENNEQEPYGAQIFAIAKAFGVSTDLLLDEAATAFDGLPVVEMRSRKWVLAERVKTIKDESKRPGDVAPAAIESKSTVRRGARKKKDAMGEDDPPVSHD